MQIIIKNEKVEVMINNANKVAFPESENFRKIFLHSQKEIEAACAGKRIFREIRTLRDGTSINVFYIEGAFEDMLKSTK